MTRVWRLLDDGPQDAAWNMAMDRAIQLAHARGEVPPTLRLYRWKRPTVTLGRFQEVDGVDLAACERAGVDVVRRFTGGRGVLHDDELTYSMILGERDGLPRGVSASYQVLCGVLAEAYRSLGVPAELTDRPRGSRNSPSCYLHATHADLSLETAKLSGSAQIWHDHTCLQHGSFVRSRDLVREAAVFGLDEASAAELTATTTTLEDVLGTTPDFEEIGRAVVEACSRGFGVSVEPRAVEESELCEARTLVGDLQVL